MLKNFILFLRLSWLAANTTRLKIKLFSDILVSFTEGICAFCAPLFLSWIIKNLSDSRPNQALFWFYGLIVAALLQWMSRYYWRYVVEPISTRLELNLRQIYFSKLFHKDYAWHLNNSVGYFSSALERVCANIHGWLCDFPIDFLPALVLIVCFFGYTFSISPWLFLYFLVALTVMFGLTYLLYGKRIGYIRALTTQNLKFNKLYIDFLYNIRSVKKMNLKPFADKKIAEQADKTAARAVDMMHYNAFQWGLMEFAIQAMCLIPVGFFLYRYIRTGSGLEVVVMITAILPQMETNGRRMMSFMTQSAKVMAEYERLSKHLGDDSRPEKTTDITKWETITFDKTEFEFVKDGHIFHHTVNFFQIHRGDHIAVTGKSGEGKSTFLNLLTGQFPCMNGQIRVNDKPYQNIGTGFFDKHIAYISQDVELFNMTLYDNIVMGKKISGPDLQKIIDGCQLNELVARMQGNLHCDIGEKGIKVSAGEKQRINLARGLLLNRDILVLDEITANLDPVTTQKIWEFIFTEYADKTIVAVSHERDLLNHISRRIEFKNGCGREIMLR